jgi:hypothetical protein
MRSAQLAVLIAPCAPVLWKATAHDRADGPDNAAKRRGPGGQSFKSGRQSIAIQGLKHNNSVLRNSLFVQRKIFPVASGRD